MNLAKKRQIGSGSFTLAAGTSSQALEAIILICFCPSSSLFDSNEAVIYSLIETQKYQFPHSQHKKRFCSLNLYCYCQDVGSKTNQASAHCLSKGVIDFRVQTRPSFSNTPNYSVKWMFQENELFLSHGSGFLGTPLRSWVGVNP